MDKPVITEDAACDFLTLHRDEGVPVTAVFPTLTLSGLTAWLFQQTSPVGVCMDPTTCLIAAYAQTLGVIEPLVLPDAQVMTDLAAYDGERLPIWTFSPALRYLGLQFDCLGEDGEVPLLSDSQALVHNISVEYPDEP